MLVPIVCFTCGLPLADKEDLFKYLKNEIIKNNKGDEEKDINCSEILNTLQIINDCCRMHLITSLTFTDYY